MHPQSAAADSVLGWFRHHGATSWAPAQFSLAADRLGVAPTADSVGSVPVEFVPLASVTGLDEVAEEQGGQRTVEIVAAGIATFEAALPAAFVDRLVDALVGSTRPVPTVAPLPVAAPVAPAVVAPAAPGTAPAGATPEATATTAPADATARRRSRLLTALAITSVLALAATAGIFWKRSADETARADAATAELGSTRTRLSDTERTLASTKDRLATTSADLSRATTDLADQKARVKELSTRVSELGNEKAKVQDERNAAQEVARLGAVAAQDMVECRDLLVDALQYVADEFFDLASSTLDEAGPVCQQANSEIAAFTAALG